MYSRSSTNRTLAPPLLLERSIQYTAGTDAQSWILWRNLNRYRRKYLYLSDQWRCDKGLMISHGLSLYLICSSSGRQAFSDRMGAGRGGGWRDSWAIQQITKQWTSFIFLLSMATISVATLLLYGSPILRRPKKKFITQPKKTATDDDVSSKADTNSTPTTSTNGAVKVGRYLKQWRETCLWMA